MNKSTSGFDVNSCYQNDLLTSLILTFWPQGVAIAMGFCAASHLDSVLGKLDSVAKNDMAQKSGGIFKFMKVIQFLYQ